MDSDAQAIIHEIRRVMQKLEQLEHEVKKIKTTVDSIQYHQQYKR